MKIFEVLDVFEAIVEYYPNFQDKSDDINKTAQAWHIFLKDVEFESVMHNLTQHVKTSRFAPTVSDLIQVIDFEDDILTGKTRAIPGLEETRLMLLEMDNHREGVATEEEKQEALDKIANILRKNRDAHYGV
jgi:type III secretory pathway component EscV